MQWFYAVGSERLGPVSPEQFSNLVADGTVSASTLVWREGFANWQAWGEVASANPLPAPQVGAIPVAAPSVEDTTKSGPELDWSINEFADRLQQNGFSTSVGGCLSRAWENYKSFFCLALGAVLVAYLLTMFAGFLPVIGMISGILVTPHMNAGMTWIFLKKARGEDVIFGDVFAGFGRCYGKLAMLGFVQFVVMLILVLVFLIPMLGMGISLDGVKSGATPEIPPEAASGIGLLFAFVFVVVLFLMIRFALAHVMAIDRPDSAIEAYKLSWRVTKGRFLTILGLGVILLLLNVAGTLALLVGLIFTMPMLSAVVAQFYHDACESASGRPPE